jgi:hypothetical protein
MKKPKLLKPISNDPPGTLNSLPGVQLRGGLATEKSKYITRAIQVVCDNFADELSSLVLEGMEDDVFQLPYKLKGISLDLNGADLTIEINIKRSKKNGRPKA